MAEILIEKVTGKGDFPPFIKLIQRHFEKARPFVPEAGATGKMQIVLTAPLDLIGMTIPASLLENIESIEMIYRKASK